MAKTVFFIMRVRPFPNRKIQFRFRHTVTHTDTHTDHSLLPNKDPINKMGFDSWKYSKRRVRASYQNTWNGIILRLVSSESTYFVLYFFRRAATINETI